MITGEAFRKKDCFTHGRFACVCPSFRARILRGKRKGVASQSRKAPDLYRGFKPSSPVALVGADGIERGILRAQPRAEILMDLQRP